MHLSIAEPEIHLLAGFLALTGLPGDDDTRKVFYALKGLLLQPRRLPRLSQSLQALPADRKKLLHLAEVCRAYGELVGGLSTGNVRVDRVIGVMLEIPDGWAYVRKLKEAGFYHLGGIFHPNTLKRARREMRGLFSGTEGEEGYWHRTSETLNIIDE